MTNDAPPAERLEELRRDFNGKNTFDYRETITELFAALAARDAEVARLTKERDDWQKAATANIELALKNHDEATTKLIALDRRALAAEARLAEVEGALRPFASLGGPDPTMVRAFPDLPEDTVIYKNSGQAFTAGDVRRARVALGVTRPNPTPSYPGLPEGAERLLEWLDSPLFEGEDAPPEHAQIAALIRRQANALAGARSAALEEAAALCKASVVHNFSPNLSQYVIFPGVIDRIRALGTPAEKEK